MHRIGWQESPEYATTIEAQKDIEVTHIPPTNREVRGKLHFVYESAKPFWLRKGQRFEMVEIAQEGGCRIRVEGKDYDIISCPWRDGFTDHQTDLFHVIESKAQLGSKQSEKKTVAAEAAFAQAQNDLVRKYFPFPMPGGSVAVFEIKVDGESVGIDIYETTENQTAIYGKPKLVVQKKPAGGQKPFGFTVYDDGTGVRYSDSTSALYLFKHPVRDGNTWADIAKPMFFPKLQNVVGETTGKIISSNETVRVPGGTFKDCLVVSLKATIRGTTTMEVSGVAKQVPFRVEQESILKIAPNQGLVYWSSQEVLYISNKEAGKSVRTTEYKGSKP